MKHILKPKLGVKGGRLNRRSFAIYYILVALILVGLTSAFDALQQSIPPEFVIIYVVVTTIVLLFFIGLSFVLMAWRFHDLGNSGWFSLLGLLLEVLVLLYLLFMHGQKKANKYGPAPK
ncbi:MAG: DUF805 domain-containing protein [Candidatus Levyibacteriota bacterium]